MRTAVQLWQHLPDDLPQGIAAAAVRAQMIGNGRTGQACQQRLQDQPGLLVSQQAVRIGKVRGDGQWLQGVQISSFFVRIGQQAVQLQFCQVW
ncbi:MAG: hypothetical protein ACKPHU_35860 [Planctomycetaceae bacterium]